MVKHKHEVKNLISIINQKELEKFFESIKLLKTIQKKEETVYESDKIIVSILDNKKNGKDVVWNNIHLFTLDVDSRLGNAGHNAVSIIRDLLKRYDHDGHWTRREIDPLMKIETNAVQIVSMDQKEKVAVN